MKNIKQAEFGRREIEIAEQGKEGSKWRTRSPFALLTKTWASAVSWKGQFLALDKHFSLYGN